MTTLHINALLYGILLSLLQIGLAFMFWQMVKDNTIANLIGNNEEYALVVLGAFFSPVYALSQVVKKFAGINGNGHPKKENVPYD